MAKKAISKLQTGTVKAYTKAIKLVKSPKTGAYVFQEEMLLNEAVKDFFSKK